MARINPMMMMTLSSIRDELFHHFKRAYKGNNCFDTRWHYVLLENNYFIILRRALDAMFDDIPLVLEMNVISWF